MRRAGPDTGLGDLLAWPQYFTDVRRILEEFREFFEMIAHPKNSPSFSGLGAKMLAVVGRTDRKSACALLKA